MIGNMKLLVTVLCMSLATNLYAGATLKVTNKSTSKVRVWVANRDSDHKTAVYCSNNVLDREKTVSTDNLSKLDKKTLDFAPGANVTNIKYTQGARGIFVEFLRPDNTVSSTVSFPFMERNSEIIIEGNGSTGTTPIADSVSFWNSVEIKKVFPSGFIPNAALITPPMMAMYYDHLNPRVQ